MEPIIDIIRPSQEEIIKYNDLWNTLEGYKLQESCLKKMFKVMYPLNNNLDDVLAKVCTLNQFYSTKIYYLNDLAKHIVSLNIDENLKNHNLEIVDQIKHVYIKSKKKYFNYYSFATKYCHHHYPNFYPLFDDYLKKMLLYFKKVDYFYSFKEEDLKIYQSFMEVIGAFRSFYNLENFSVKEVDIYLWLAGKYYFPRKKKEDN